MRTVLFLAGLLFVSIIPVSFSETITINTNKEQFVGGDTVEINGNVENGNAGDFVALEIKNPDGETVLIRTVTIGDGGSFYLKFKIPDSGKAGNYDIVVNSQHEGQIVSETKTITQSMQKLNSDQKSATGGCLIATATYGTEMAPQVQLLREIRDNSLLQTKSGSTFMTMFNNFYYSFSPTIADYERENPLFKEAVKLTITPMMSTLSIMEFADSESEVLGYGIGLIMLNGMMYFGIPAVVIIKIRK
jgi:hypothetical protein